MISALISVMCGVSAAGLFFGLTNGIKSFSSADEIFRYAALLFNKACGILGGLLLRISFFAKWGDYCVNLIRKCSLKLAVELFVGRQAACCILIFFLALLAAGSVPAAALCAAAGFFVPYLSIYNAGKKRMAQVAGELPDFLDLVTLLVESGCDLGAALKIVSSMEKGVLYSEIGAACEEMRFGKSRIAALEGVSSRVGEKNLSSVITSLVQSMKAGAPVGKTLRMLSDQIREEKTADIEKQVSEAQIKILFPIIIFIFPTIFLVIFGPVVLSFMK